MGGAAQADEVFVKAGVCVGEISLERRRGREGGVRKGMVRGERGQI